MPYRLDKKTLLFLFCVLREAERSVDYALSSPQLWDEFVAYFDQAKRARVMDLICLLKETGVSFEDFTQVKASARNKIVALVQSAVGVLVNPLKSHWTFTKADIPLFSAVLKRLLIVLAAPFRPPIDDLISLRRDCYDCCYVISRKMVGVRELRKADSIEHFRQSAYVNHVTFEEMGLAVSHAACAAPASRKPA